VNVGTAQIATPLDEFDALQRDFVWTAIIGAPLLLLVASAAGYWMSGRALQPVDDIATTARRISAQNLAERLPANGSGDELDRLSQVLNEMLAGLESSFRRMTQFTADASHELRTPMAIIRTTAEVISSRPRTADEHCRAWQVVATQAERTSELIADLLLLARADSGLETPIFEPLDLAKVVRDASGEMSVLAERKGLGLKVEAETECPTRGDKEALRRVISILLDNAIKFTAAGGIYATVAVCGRFSSVLVKDSGIGIAPEDLPHVFDRFYRAARDRSRKTGGAGLGLAIAKGIALLHGGDVSVESELGAGSVFKLEMPVTEKPQSAFDAAAEITQSSHC
jgi:heavy metal sensor kinase